MLSRVEVVGNATLYLGDCREVLPTLTGVDCILTDPPYGIAFAHGGNDRSGIGSGRYATKFAGIKIEGDSSPFDPELLLSLEVPSILWGGNHYAGMLPSSSCWLIWDKRAASMHSNDFADCEIAWTNIPHVARIFRHHWDGMMKASERGIPREHPTQKPIAVMEWCLGLLPDSRTALDPFMGSGTTGVACARLGRPFIGVEIEERYFDIACRRISDSQRQRDLFVDAPVPQPPEDARLDLFYEPQE